MGSFLSKKLSIGSVYIIFGVAAMIVNVYVLVFFKEEKVKIA